MLSRLNNANLLTTLLHWWLLYVLFVPIQSISLIVDYIRLHLLSNHGNKECYLKILTSTLLQKRKQYTCVSRIDSMHPFKEGAYQRRQRYLYLAGFVAVIIEFTSKSNVILAVILLTTDVGISASSASLTSLSNSCQQ